MTLAISRYCLEICSERQKNTKNRSQDNW